MDYSFVTYRASDSPGEDNAAGGMFRFYASWDLVGRGTANNGALVFKASHRHAYTCGHLGRPAV